MKLLDKKGQVFTQVSGIMVGLATIGIIAVVTFLVISMARTQVVALDDVNVSDTATWSTAYNATNTVGDSMATAVNFIPLIVIAAIGAVLLGLVALFRSRR